MNLTWIQNARTAFAAVYGGKKGLSVSDAVIPGILGDFRRMLEAAAPGDVVRETYRLDDKKGDIRLEGRREGADLVVTALTVAGRDVDLGGRVVL